MHNAHFNMHELIPTNMHSTSLYNIVHMVLKCKILICFIIKKGMQEKIPPHNNYQLHAYIVYYSAKVHHVPWHQNIFVILRVSRWWLCCTLYEQPHTFHISCYYYDTRVFLSPDDTGDCARLYMSACNFPLNNYFTRAWKHKVRSRGVLITNSLWTAGKIKRENSSANVCLV